jgi:hypothetical protein
LKIALRPAGPPRYPYACCETRCFTTRRGKAHAGRAAAACGVAPPGWPCKSARSTAATCDCSARFCSAVATPESREESLLPVRCLSCPLPHVGRSGDRLARSEGVAAAGRPCDKLPLQPRSVWRRDDLPAIPRMPGRPPLPCSLGGPGRSPPSTRGMARRPPGGVTIATAAAAARGTLIRFLAQGGYP